jgi:hypothetical protein
MNFQDDRTMSWVETQLAANHGVRPESTSPFTSTAKTENASSAGSATVTVTDDAAAEKHQAARTPMNPSASGAAFSSRAVESHPSVKPLTQTDSVGPELGEKSGGLEDAIPPNELVVEDIWTDIVHRAGCRELGVPGKEINYRGKIVLRGGTLTASHPIHVLGVLQLRGDGPFDISKSDRSSIDVPVEFRGAGNVIARHANRIHPGYVQRGSGRVQYID